MTFPPSGSGLLYTLNIRLSSQHIGTAYPNLASHSPFTLSVRSAAVSGVNSVIYGTATPVQA
eukprot:606457-Prorocentrum_minimum.AAC.7